jgi:hypothetical protein
MMMIRGLLMYIMHGVGGEVPVLYIHLDRA